MKKQVYEKPIVVDLMNNSLVYGQHITPLGQCCDGNAPEGQTYGCGAGGAHTPGTCDFGSFPDDANCSAGSYAGYSNQCATGATLD